MSKVAEAEKPTFWSYAGIAKPDRLSPYGVEETAAILRRFAYIEQRLVQSLAAWLAAAPEIEVKYGIGRHLWEDAEHAQALRQRVGQLRMNPRILEKTPNHYLGLLLDELVYAQDSQEFIAGVYLLVKRHLVQAYRDHLSVTQPLVDFPTVRVLKIILAEEEEHLQWAEEALRHLDVSAATQQKLENWQAHLGAYLSAAGGIAGLAREDEDRVIPVGRSATQPPFEVHPTGARDARFKAMPPRDSPEEVKQPPPPVLHHMARSRWAEMQAAEGIAASIYEYGGHMPWEYTYDLARHCWDEVRHCCFGHLFMESLGMKVTDYPVMTGNYEFYRQLSPFERYVRLGIMIEQAAMAKNGKRREYEVCKEEGHALGAQFQDYDWADEVMHAQLARKWTEYMAAEQDTSVEEAIEAINEKYEAFTRPWVEKGYRF